MYYQKRRREITTLINNNLTKEFDINALWSINKGLSDERVVGTLTVAKNEMILELPI